MDTYDRIEMLLDERKISAYGLSKGTGISTGLLSQWKKRSQNPSSEKLKIIAAFFEVSVDYLMTGKENENSEKSAFQEKNELSDLYFSIAKDLQDNEIDPEDVRTLINLIKKNSDVIKRHRNNDKS